MSGRTFVLLGPFAGTYTAVEMRVSPYLLFLAVPLAARAQGRIEVAGPDSIDFGKYPARERKVARYTVRNAGTNDLRILKVRKTCGCASATASRTELEPGDEAEIEVVILPNSIFKLYSKNTYVESTDPNNRFLRLTVAGNAIPLVDVQPKAEVYLGRIKLNAGRSQVFELRGSRKDVRLGEPATTSTRPALASLTPDGETGGPWQLTVKLLPTAQSGDLRCTVKIPVLAPKGHPPLQVKVLGKVGYELVAIPGTVWLPVSEGPVTRKCAFRVVGQRSRVLKPEELTVPKHDHISFRVSRDNVRRALVVAATFSPEFTKELFAEETIPLSFSVSGASSAKVVCKSKK